MKVYITKYALTEGIIELQDVESPKEFPTMIVDRRKEAGGWHSYHKPHWHENEREAIARAEEMRVAKIRSLRKQLSKLEKMKFEAVGVV